MTTPKILLKMIDKINQKNIRIWTNPNSKLEFGKVSELTFLNDQGSFRKKQNFIWEFDPGSG